LAAGALLSSNGSPARADRVDREASSIYLADCSTCHGADGTGTSRGPSLRNAGAASVDFMVRTGRMPLASPGATDRRKPSPYSATEQADLIRYVTGLTMGGPEIPVVHPGRGDVANGGQLYRLQCAACHSWGGNGGALLGREAPAITAAGPVQVAEAVRTGPGSMPAFGNAALDHRELDDLVAYTRTLRSPDDRGGWNLGHLGPVSEGAAALVLGLGLMILSIRWLGTNR